MQSPATVATQGVASREFYHVTIQYIDYIIVLTLKQCLLLDDHRTVRLKSQSVLAPKGMSRLTIPPNVCRSRSAWRFVRCSAKEDIDVVKQSIRDPSIASMFPRLPECTLNHRADLLNTFALTQLDRSFLESGMVPVMSFQKQSLVVEDFVAERGESVFQLFEPLGLGSAFALLIVEADVELLDLAQSGSQRTAEFIDCAIMSGHLLVQIVHERFFVKDAFWTVIRSG